MDARTQFHQFLAEPTREYGEFTADELAEEANISVRSVMRKLRPGLADGTIERRKVRTPTNDWCYVYRYTPQEEAQNG